MENTQPSPIRAEDYLALEAQAQQKHEFHNGQIVAMAGAQLAHNQLVNNLLFLINRCLWGTHCQALPSDMLLHLPACKRFVYPDLMVVCGEPQTELRNGVEFLLNPVLVVEVLSKSTREEDQQHKKKCYLQLESLQEYLIVDSENVFAESYRRNGEKSWNYTSASALESEITVQECSFLLREVYQRVKGLGT